MSLITIDGAVKAALVSPEKMQHYAFEYDQVLPLDKQGFAEMSTVLKFSKHFTLVDVTRVPDHNLVILSVTEYNATQHRRRLFHIQFEKIVERWYAHRDVPEFEPYPTVRISKIYTFFRS